MAGSTSGIPVPLSSLSNKNCLPHPTPSCQSLLPSRNGSTRSLRAFWLLVSPLLATPVLLGGASTSRLSSRLNKLKMPPIRNKDQLSFIGGRARVGEARCLSRSSETLGPLFLVLSVTVCDDIADVLVVYVAAHIWREGCPHVLDLWEDAGVSLGPVLKLPLLESFPFPGPPQLTSSWENLSHCVVSNSSRLRR